MNKKALASLAVFVALIIGASLDVSAAHKSTAKIANASSDANDLSDTTSGGVTFHREKIKVGGHEIKVEIADNDDRRERGLMERTTLSDRDGMIFVFPKSRTVSFWMKDTLIPLSIGFFSESGKLFQITDMEPASPMDTSPQLYNSMKPAKYALEVAKGWFKRKHVDLGAQLEMRSLNVVPAK
jgi:uncharacterized protein